MTGNVMCAAASVSSPVLCYILKYRLDMDTLELKKVSEMLLLHVPGTPLVLGGRSPMDWSHFVCELLK